MFIRPRINQTTSIDDIHFGKTAIDDAIRKCLKLLWSSSGEAVDARHSSNGALLYLAFLTLVESPDAPAVLLIEEPENGIHPTGLQFVIERLRSLTHKTQVRSS